MTKSLTRRLYLLAVGLNLAIFALLLQAGIIAPNGKDKVLTSGDYTDEYQLIDGSRLPDSRPAYFSSSDWTFELRSNSSVDFNNALSRRK